MVYFCNDTSEAELDSSISAVNRTSPPRWVIDVHTCAVTIDANDLALIQIVVEEAKLRHHVPQHLRNERNQRRSRRSCSRKLNRIHVATTLTSPEYLTRGGKAACSGTFSEHSERKDPKKMPPKMTGYVKPPRHTSGTLFEEEQGYTTDDHDHNSNDGHETVDDHNRTKRWVNAGDDEKLEDEDYIAEDLCTEQMCGECRKEMERNEKKTCHTESGH